MSFVIELSHTSQVASGKIRAICPFVSFVFEQSGKSQRHAQRAPVKVPWRDSPVTIWITIIASQVSKKVRIASAAGS